MDLRGIVAKLCGRSPAEIHADFPLNQAGLQGSMRRAVLAAAIRRHLGVECRQVGTAKTYGELEAAMQGRASQPVPAESGAPQPAAAAAGPLACGVDIQDVADFPESADYWEHEFYRDNFSPGEIAYCVTRKNPRASFAGRWCAKEGLKKCDADFLNEKMSDLEVVRSDSGALSLWRRSGGVARKLNHAVSISHTESMAVAAVVNSLASLSEWPEPPAVPAPPPRGGPVWSLASILSVVAVALALLALLRTRGLVTH